jgi:hypothetical protein
MASLSLKTFTKDFSRSLLGASWLTDNVISEIYSSFAPSDGCDFPEGVLLLTPAQCHQISVGTEAAAVEQVFELCLVSRHLVVCPVSDGAAHGADTGSHWSLLVLLRTRRQARAGECSFKAIHLNSSHGQPNQMRAIRLGTRLLGDAFPGVERGLCSEQVNGHDCGLYLLKFTEIMVAFYMQSPSWLSFSVSDTWRCALQNISPRHISAYRGSLVKKLRRDLRGQGVSDSETGSAAAPQERQPVKRVRLNCKTSIVTKTASGETSGQGDVLLVTQSAADIIGRVAGDASADAIFCERMALEVQHYRSQVHESHLHERYCRDSEPWQCRLCPYKSFYKAKDLLNHLDKQHKGGLKHPIRGYISFARAVFDAAGLKTAPWDLMTPAAACSVALGKDSDWKDVVSDRPLEETARLVRSWNTGVIRPNFIKWGCGRQDFRPLWTECGGRLLLQNHPDHAAAVCISSHSSVSQSFIRAIAATALVSQGKPKLIREALARDASKTPLDYGMPEALPTGCFIGSLLSRIFGGETVTKRIQEMRTTVGFLFGEFSDLNIDAAVSVMQSIVGNVPEGKSGVRLPHQERCCMTVKGRTGAVLELTPATDEGFDEQARALENAVPSANRNEVMSLCTDCPPKLMSNPTRLRAIYPKLRCVSEDPGHGKFRLEACSNGNSNQISTLVHGINMDLFQAPKTFEASETYRWDAATVEKEGLEADTAYQENLLISTAEAKLLIERASQMSGGATDYGALLAAAAVIGSADMSRNDGKGKDSRTMGEILNAQCYHYSFLRNHALRRGEMTPKEQSEKACGTLSNEAFHKEVAVWGQRVHRQTRALLVAKLNALLFMKLATFIYRKFHTSAQAQGYVAGVVAAQIVAGGDLALAQKDDDEYAKQQKDAQSATEREIEYKKKEKLRKQRLALARGIKFLYPERNDARALRAAARGRTFQSRCSHIPRQSAAAVKSRIWRQKLRAKAVQLRGVLVRKRNKILPRRGRAALAVSLQHSMGSKTTEAEKQKQADQRKTEDPETDGQMVAERKKRDSPEERKQERAKLARARKERFKRLHPKEPRTKEPLDEAASTARKESIAQLARERKRRYNLNHLKCPKRKPAGVVSSLSRRCRARALTRLL